MFYFLLDVILIAFEVAQEQMGGLGVYLPYFLVSKLYQIEQIASIQEVILMKAYLDLFLVLEV